jgi:hypothetical protein
MRKKKHKRLRGKVQKVVKAILPSEPEKAEVRVEEADELYCEIRVENVLPTRMAKRFGSNLEPRLTSFLKRTRMQQPKSLISITTAEI